MGNVGPRAASLADDGHLLHSEYLRALAARAGCRDADELWDQLFELRGPRLSTAAFVRELLAYCLLARLSYGQAELAADGTVARERAMAAAVQGARKRHGPGAVVVACRRLSPTSAGAPPPPGCPPTRAGTAPPSSTSTAGRPTAAPAACCTP